MIYLTVVNGLLVAVIGVLLYLRDREREANAEILADFSRRAEGERLQLVNHIKAPTYLSPTGSLGFESQRTSPPHPNLAKIGTYAPVADGDD